MFFLFMSPDQVLPSYPELMPLESALDAFVALDPSMPVSTAATLLRVARFAQDLHTGETNLRAIARNSELPYSTLLRQIDRLADGAGPRVKSLELLEKGFNATDRRARAVRLTQQGIRFLDHLRRIFTEARVLNKTFPEFYEIPETPPIPEKED